MPEMPEPLTDTQLRELAFSMVHNQIFSTGNVPPALWPVVFLPMALGGLDGLTDQQINDLTCYAVVGWHAVCDTLIIGYPCFTECVFVLRNDYNRAVVLATQMARRTMNELPVPDAVTTEAPDKAEGPEDTDGTSTTTRSVDG
jgi:hypothetical protein